MLLIDFVYKENRFFGLVAMKIELTDPTLFLKESILSSINGMSPVEMGISIDYINRHRAVYFCLNSYRLPNTTLSDIRIYSGTHFDQVYLSVNNDTPAGNFNSKLFNSTPVFIPYPVSSKLWNNFPEKNFPTMPDLSLISIDEISAFEKQGWTVLENILDSSLLDGARYQIERECALGYGGYLEGSSMRIKHLHFQNGPVRDIYFDSKLRKYISAIFGTPMSPCQSLIYRFGSEQSFHSDFVHLTAYPENLMCGVWIALEDVDMEAGPLGLISGSHLAPRLTMQDFDLKPVTNDDYSVFSQTFNNVWESYADTKSTEFALLKKGQILVWDGNLLHCGTRRVNVEKTRHSIVLHFFADGAVCIYDALGVVGNPG